MILHSFVSKRNLAKLILDFAVMQTFKQDDDDDDDDEKSELKNVVR